MKAFLIAGLTMALACGTAAAQSSAPKQETTGQAVKSPNMQHGHRANDGYYRPGIPPSDPGRYSNLPGKDAAGSKAYIQDH